MVVTYNKRKDIVDPLTQEELDNLKSESLPNTFRCIEYYRNMICRLIKTIETR